MDENDSSKYIDHRLKIAGAKKSIFDAKAKKMIYRYSSGIPRIINGIGDMALLEGYSENVDIIGEVIIKNIVKISQLEEPRIA